MEANDEVSTAISTLLSTPICTILPEQPEEYFPPCVDEKKPKLGDLYNTIEEGVQFYKDYAKHCGFQTRLGTTKRQKRNAEVFTLRRVLCNKAGTREEYKDKKTDRVRLITHGKYKVTGFHEGHNHILASPSSMLFMKENRKMTSIQKTFVVKAARLKMGPVKAFRGWKELTGGYSNVGATETDFKNFVRNMKQYIGLSDAQMVVDNFSQKKETCSTFYFDFEVDEKQCLSGLFWADTISRKNYALFGDMLSIDSTFRTNKYDMVFVPFTDVDQHKRCVTVGAGLLSHESIEAYTWLFKAFLDAMGGCAPKAIITDQCPSMKPAIEEVFPNTSHRLCMWHIMKKLREKVDAYLWQDEDFKKRLNACVWNNHCEPDEFEEAWANIMIDYDLVDHPWFSSLYEIKEDWVPAYFREIFMAGIMRVTSRSESENSFFDRFLTPHATLVEFWMSFESAMDAQHHKQSKLDSENKHSTSPLKTPVQLEKHACKFTRMQLLRTSRMHYVQQCTIVAWWTYMLRTAQRYILSAT
ncbi:protein FAR1-RELATED SEQUENCE 5-like [Silene latifolia]|uniref:protein FAR1-RELATED SEQUENCE 5-like n=1 Tax=Silene latifolia TaxID=37657 RepID=UPI003D784D73